MQLSALEIADINSQLEDKTATEIIEWAIKQNKKTVVTTSFGYNSAVTLHLVTQVRQSVPVVWVDSGYNLEDSYVVAEKLIQELGLNIHVYNPVMSTARREAVHGASFGVPDNPEFESFRFQVKLEPFQRALKELQPEIWISGIRGEETEYRRNLGIVSLDDRGILKVSPLFHWTEADVSNYMRKYNLPSCRHYFDPTKVDSQTECGLHLSQFEQGGGI